MVVTLTTYLVCVLHHGARGLHGGEVRDVEEGGEGEALERGVALRVD